MQVPLKKDITHSLSFNGVDQFLDLGTLQGSGLSLNRDWLSMLFWLKTPAQTPSTFMGISDPGSSNYLAVSLNSQNDNTTSTDTLRTFLSDNTGVFNNVQTGHTISLTDNSWHAIMLQWQPSSNLYQFWTDKSKRVTTSASSSVLNHWTKFATSFLIGGIDSPPGPGSSNLVANGTFESGLGGWTADGQYTRSNEDAHGGLWSVKQVSPAGSFQNFTTVNDATGINVSANSSYTFKYWTKMTVNSGNAPLMYINTGGAYGSTIATSFPTDTGGVWVQKSVQFNTGAATKVWIRLTNNGGDIVAFYDDFSITADANSNSIPLSSMPFKIANFCMFRSQLTQFDFLEWQRGMMRQQDVFVQYKMSEGTGNSVRESISGLTGTLISPNADVSTMWTTDTPY